MSNPHLPTSDLDNINERGKREKNVDLLQLMVTFKILNNNIGQCKFFFKFVQPYLMFKNTFEL